MNGNRLLELLYLPHSQRSFPIQINRIYLTNLSAKKHQLFDLSMHKSSEMYGKTLVVEFDANKMLEFTEINEENDIKSVLKM